MDLVLFSFFFWLYYYYYYSLYYTTPFIRPLPFATCFSSSILRLLSTVASIPDPERTNILSILWQFWHKQKYRTLQETEYEQNLWRRKCVRRAIFRNVVAPPSTLTLFATRPTASLCDLSGVILHQKWIKPFLSEILCWIFFYSTILSKKAVFSEKTAKNCFGGRIWQFFRERRRLTPKINITYLSQMRNWIFYYLPIFSKNV